MAVYLVVWALAILASGVIAYYKSRRVWLWVVFGLVIPPFGVATLLLVALLPTRHAARLQESEARAALRG